jgi:peptidoglycan/xylan/chitin deacetylase (PgdA/CDA1 family)
VTGPTFPRRADRKRRIRACSVRVMAGAATGAALWFGFGGNAGAALAVAALVAGFLCGHRFMIAPPGVPILTYHSVSPDASWLPWADEITVHPETLRNHLATMHAMGCTIVSTRSLVEARRTGQPLPARPLVLHFDDGYLDNWLHAAPLLREAKAPATFYASLDFIAPGDSLRGGGDDRGYMNWAELSALGSDPLFEVEPHGIDHGRVPISTRTVGTLTASNWRSLAWMQWAQVPGAKHDWYLWENPPAVPLGTPVPESEGALAAPALGDTEVEYRARVGAHLGRCADEFATHFGHAPATFCWPENRVSATAREIAAGAGYLATTGGAGRNTATEPPEVLSRIHAGDRALGLRFGAAERLHIRAVIGLFEGNHYWYLVSGPMSLARKLVMALRPRLARLATRVPAVSIRHSRNPRRPRPVSR